MAEINQPITRWQCNKCRDTWCQQFTTREKAPSSNCAEAKDNEANWWKVY